MTTPPKVARYVTSTDSANELVETTKKQTKKNKRRVRRR